MRQQNATYESDSNNRNINLESTLGKMSELPNPTKTVIGNVADIANDVSKTLKFVGTGPSDRQTANVTLPTGVYLVFNTHWGNSDVYLLKWGGYSPYHFKVTHLVGTDTLTFTDKSTYLQITATGTSRCNIYRLQQATYT